MTLDDDQAARIAECELNGTLRWYLHAGIHSIVLREKGEEVASEVWRRLMLGQQSDKYLEGARKCGILDTEPPAVRAAKYHYLSNTIGGLRLHYIEESPKKVWIRYLAPLGSYPGMAMLMAPIALRRTILSTWHPRNGELMGCPRLGWVLTKTVAFGEPYDEGYFYEYDHDLKPEERVRFEAVSESPEFDPAKAPQLPEGQWSALRLARASRNYATGYLDELVGVLRAMFGERTAAYLCETAAACVAVQFTPALCDAASVTGNDVAAVATLFTRLAVACGQSVEQRQIATGHLTLSVAGPKPFLNMPTLALREAFFQLQVVATRMLNGRIAVSRAETGTGHDLTEVWEIRDTGRWLW
ncbi:hypothetical protein [Paraburkholderia sp. ZP32-5]|uniref:hypothetical protein n=1 Tax=Paraburkholderia sp. ZP32-5 TaxID=2883245 RepID=UPI001F1AAE43|nr:hypothetical protein [Paraburkholderia sp. ZP32-5]